MQTLLIQSGHGHSLVPPPSAGAPAAGLLRVILTEFPQVERNLPKSQFSSHAERVVEGNELAVFAFSLWESSALGKESHGCAVGDSQVRLPVNCPRPSVLRSKPPGRKEDGLAPRSLL